MMAAVSTKEASRPFAERQRVLVLAGIGIENSTFDTASDSDTDCAN
jgi:hypothetical protein